MTLCSLFNLQINMDRNIELIIFFVDKNSIVYIIKLTINIKLFMKKVVFRSINGKGKENSTKFKFNI